MLQMPLTGKPLIIILGPTAIGKTRLAIELAAHFHGEILNADSRQIYRYMTIGTAKPTLEEQALIPHHLLDLITPDQSLSVAEFQRQAYALIEKLHADNKVPFLVGGTGQYLTAIVEGWTIPEVPPNDDLRLELESYATNFGAEALYQHLITIDPPIALKIDARNVRRVIRAIEVYRITGKRMSEWQQKHPPAYAMLTIGLTMPRATLYERADQRVDHMLQAGFVQEVQDLLAQGYASTLPSMSGIGYRELSDYLSHHINLPTALEKTKYATHAFIRKQYTWFNGHNFPSFQWYDVSEHNASHLIKQIKQGLLL